MQRVVKKSRDFADAQKWDILQHVRMSPEERQRAAAELRARAYRKNAADVRDTGRRK